MQLFKIKVLSFSIYSSSTAIIVLSGMFIGVSMALNNANDVYFFILILFGLTALVFIPNWLSTAKTEWSVSEKGIEIKWLSQFLFLKKTDRSITWENIDQYKFQPGREFSYLELKLRDNTTLKYWHSNSTYEDEFDEFLTYFQKQVIEFNDTGINVLHPIRRKKTIYETTKGVVLAIVTAILLISFPILIIVLNPAKVNWVGIITAYSGGIYFISKVVSYNRKKKQLK
jgi:hypothetical protein